AKAVLDLAAEKAGWGQALPKGSGRGVSLQFVFGSYQAHVAEVEVSNEGTVRVGRVVCAVDCGTVVNPDTVQAQIQSGIIFGAPAALYGEITLKNGRVEQTNFDTYQMLRMNEAPAIEVHIVKSAEPPGGMGETMRSSPQPGSACARCRSMCESNGACSAVDDERELRDALALLVDDAEHGLSIGIALLQQEEAIAALQWHNRLDCKRILHLHTMRAY